MFKNDPIYFEQSIQDRFIHPSTKLGKFARNISVAVAGIAISVVAFFTFKPNPKEDLTDQFKQNLDGFDSFVDDPNITVSDNDIFAFKPISVRLANGSQCTATFRIRLQPSLDYAYEFNDAGDCNKGELSGRPQDAIEGNICEANLSTEKLKQELRRNLPGFKKITSSVDPKSRDCEDTTAAVRPVYIDTTDDSCDQVWALVAPKNGLTLFDTLPC